MMYDDMNFKNNNNNNTKKRKAKETKIPSRRDEPTHTHRREKCHPNPAPIGGGYIRLS